MASDRGNKVNITTNTTTAVAAGSGLLLNVVINTKGGASNTLKLYDDPSTTNNLFATIDTTANVGTLIYDCICINGLTAVTATGTCADITITFR